MPKDRPHPILGTFTSVESHFVASFRDYAFSAERVDQAEIQKSDMLSKIKNFRPPQTVSCHLRLAASCLTLISICEKGVRDGRQEERKEYDSADRHGVEAPLA